MIKYKIVIFFTLLWLITLGVDASYVHFVYNPEFSLLLSLPILLSLIIRYIYLIYFSLIIFPFKFPDIKNTPVIKCMASLIILIIIFIHMHMAATFIAIETSDHIDVINKISNELIGYLAHNLILDSSYILIFSLISLTLHIFKKLLNILIIFFKGDQSKI